jgi:hypothetical protein
MPPSKVNGKELLRIKKEFLTRKIPIHIPQNSKKDHSSPLSLKNT